MNKKFKLLSKSNSIDPNFKDAVFNIGLAYLKLNRTFIFLTELYC